MKKILIVEDNADIQKQMKWALSKDYDVLCASDRTEAMEVFEKEQPMVVTLDLGLPPDEDDASEGLACLHDLISAAPQTKVIVVTGNSERGNALTAVKTGAYDYFTKPVDMNDLKVIVQRAFHLASIESENRHLHQILNKDMGFAGMIGQCAEMQGIFEMIRQVAFTDVSVLITGESGTGKELVARAIHDKSSRSTGPFIPINCGAIPENLLESELFGHEKGSFTNAYAQQKGKFEYAHKGTLFLDEIGEMAPALQAKMLRFLQERKMQRVGGRKDIDIDTRIIAATNIDLNTAMEEKKFREDLFFRVSVITINIPPLRDRGDDIMLLAEALLERYKVMFNKNILGFSKSAEIAMRRYAWPGNVRELENKLQKGVITAGSSTIEPENMGLAPEEAGRVHESGRAIRYDGITLKEARKQLEMDIISRAIEKHGGNIKRASEELGVSRPTLYDLIDKYSLSAKAEAK